LNVLGTVDGAGRSRKAVILGVVVGSVTGGGLLGVLLVIAWIPFHLLSTTTRELALATVIIVLLWVELTRRPLYRLSGNFQVPAAWVWPPSFRSGLLWGTLLGPGLITQAPRGVFFAALAASVLQPLWWVAGLAGIVFAVSRASLSAVGWVRARVLAMSQAPARRGHHTVATLRGRAGSVSRLVSVAGLLLGVAAVLATLVTG
jgi:hypothetical protein